MEQQNLQKNDNVLAVNGLLSLSDREYAMISQLVYEKFGINLGEKKRSLVLGRLHKLVRQYNFNNFEQFYKFVLQDSTGEALSALVDRISTNHTYFYRENAHYDYFSSQVLPQLISSLSARRESSIRIWSAGCSSGEEPYTLAMLLGEYLGTDLPRWKIGILATDISERVLEKAREGIYSKENVSKLPPKYRQKYFTPLANGQMQVNDSLKKMVLFRRLNLIRPSFPFRQKFHSIFCRNVMIYFDMPTREKIVGNFYNFMDPGAHFFIGMSESLGRRNPFFNYVQPAIYQKAY